MAETFSYNLDTEQPEEHTTASLLYVLHEALKYYPKEAVTPEDTRVIFQKKLGELAAIMPEFAALLNEPLVDRNSYYARIRTALFLLAERVNFRVTLYDPGSGQYFEGITEGEIVREDRRITGVKVQVLDPQGVLERDPVVKNVYDAVLSEMEGFRRQSDFKAYIVVDSGMLAIRMDPGSHKEFLACLPPEGGKEGMLLYKHLFSSQEKDPKSNSERQSFISEVLREVRSHPIAVEANGISAIIDIRSGQPRRTGAAPRSFM